ncbi:BRO family protein [Enterobacter asburiae]|nr:BRO family protein [Enterobacter asburiae]
MKSELTFQNHTITTYDNGDFRVWFTTKTLSELLGYADEKQVNKIFQRHKDEFTGSMTTKVTVSDKSNTYGYLSNDLRLFSPRGAHLIGMVSRTKVAKELRRWLLDLVEKESGIQIAPLDTNELIQMSGQQIHDAIDRFDKLSIKHRGRKGSSLMNQRKRDIQKIKQATKLAIQLTQLQLPDMGDFPEDSE